MRHEVERVIYIPARVWQSRPEPLLRQVITRADIRREVERPSRRALVVSIVVNLALLATLAWMGLA